MSRRTSLLKTKNVVEKPTSTPRKINPAFSSMNNSYSPDVNYQNIEFFDEMMREERRDTLSNLYKDLLVAQIVFTHINDGLSEWREINNTTFEEHDKRLKLKRIAVDSWTAYRKYGHVLILPILVNADNVKIPFSVPFDRAMEQKPTIERIIVVDNFESSEKTITDVLNADHGKHQKYKINNKPIHPSRVIQVGRLGEQSMLEGLVSYHNTYHTRSFETTRAVKESNFLVLATSFADMQNAVEMSLGDNTSETVLFKKLVEAMETRARNLRENANNENAFIIDKDSEQMSNIAKQNIDHMTNATKDSLSIYVAAADYPRSRLLGESVSSWSDTDTSNYVQTIHGKRMMEIEDAVVSLDEFIGKVYGIKDTSFTWNPLAIEKITINKTSSPTVIDNQAVT